jgi:hypothetical protein
MRFLLILLPIIFTIYTILDCAGTDAAQVRNLPKWGWLLIIILVAPIIGPVAYWIAGRPVRATRFNLGGGSRRIIPPDDDPDFLKKI